MSRSINSGSRPFPETTRYYELPRLENTAVELRRSSVPRNRSIALHTKGIATPNTDQFPSARINCQSRGCFNVRSKSVIIRMFADSPRNGAASLEKPIDLAAINILATPSAACRATTASGNYSTDRRYARSSR